MEEEKLKVFISYSHKDNLEKNSYIEEFKAHIAPLRNNGFINDWYDREIYPGKDFNSEIDSNLEDADIICLFISHNFLSSSACLDEKTRALELKESKGISVIPIILSSCAWKDDKDVSKLLALPTDGKPLLSFSERNEGWLDVYNGLKIVIENEIKIKELKITESFENFLQDTEMLLKSHSQKENVFLDDIFVYPELDKYDLSAEGEEKINSKILFDNVLDYPKIVIAGEDQSGKTTLCKLLFKKLRDKNFIPVYVQDKKSQFERNIEKIISRSFREEYEGINLKEIDESRIIPIIDDFHTAKNKERHINDLSKYSRCILIVDDIFCINIKDEKLIGSFIRFTIREFKPSLIDKLIRKWGNLTDKETRDIDTYKNIDKRTELINNTVIRGIMPAYPFFILSVIFTTETASMPLNQEITSQGYFYQSCIYFYLNMQGVKNDDTDTYMNFLTELAFYFYTKKKNELTPADFDEFMNWYDEKYNLTIEQDILLANLSQIASKNVFNNYTFRARYFYYFFVAKYLSEHKNNEVKKEIENILENLQVTENAYIAVFIAHHSRDNKILDAIREIAKQLFEKYERATLTKDEVKFFDDQLDDVIDAALPAESLPEKRRKEILDREDKLEESKKNKEREDEDGVDFSEMELRRAIKTVEVMGSIIKNRAGSLEKTQLENLFKEAMNVYLRILSSLFEIIKNEDGQKDIIDTISENLKKSIEKNEEILGEPSEDEMKRMARIIFWNLCFLIVNGTISMIVHSLGSDKLIKIVSKVCDEENTPASFIVKHGILMWYDKNPQLEEIAKKIKEKNFSDIAERELKFMAVNYVSLHPTDYRGRQQIETKLGIPVQRLVKISRE